MGAKAQRLGCEPPLGRTQDSVVLSAMCLEFHFQSVSSNLRRASLKSMLGILLDTSLINTGFLSVYFIVSLNLSDKQYELI